MSGIYYQSNSTKTNQYYRHIIREEKMIVGCPKEIKPQEFRVGLTPAAVHELTGHGHTVLIETNAGTGSGFTNDDYVAAGATLIETAAEVF